MGLMFELALWSFCQHSVSIMMIAEAVAIRFNEHLHATLVDIRAGSHHVSVSARRWTHLLLQSCPSSDCVVLQWPSCTQNNQGLSIIVKSRTHVARSHMHSSSIRCLAELFLSCIVHGAAPTKCPVTSRFCNVPFFPMHLVVWG